MTNEEYLDYWLLPPWGKMLCHSFPLMFPMKCTIFFQQILVWNHSLFSPFVIFKVRMPVNMVVGIIKLYYFYDTLRAPPSFIISYIIPSRNKIHRFYQIFSYMYLYYTLRFCLLVFFAPEMCAF